MFSNFGKNLCAYWGLLQYDAWLFFDRKILKFWVMDDLGVPASQESPLMVPKVFPATYPHTSFHLSFCKASAGRLGQKPIGPVNALLCGAKVSKTLSQHYVFEQHETLKHLKYHASTH